MCILVFSSRCLKYLLHLFRHWSSYTATTVQPFGQPGDNFVSFLLCIFQKYKRGSKTGTKARNKFKRVPVPPSDSTESDDSCTSGEENKAGNKTSSAGKLRSRVIESCSSEEEETIPTCKKRQKHNSLIVDSDLSETEAERKQGGAMGTEDSGMAEDSGGDINEGCNPGGASTEDTEDCVQHDVSRLEPLDDAVQSDFSSDSDLESTEMNKNISISRRHCASSVDSCPSDSDTEEVEDVSRRRHPSERALLMDERRQAKKRLFDEMKRQRAKHKRASVEAAT